KKHPFNFEHLINAEKFTDQLGITAYPMNLFLDKNGVLKYVKGGIPYVKLEGEELKMGEGNEIIEILEKLK
ncbi:MAG: TlpA family protein disulfide reductase, partial [Polaribacter sp.]